MNFKKIDNNFFTKFGIYFNYDNYDNYDNCDKFHNNDNQNDNTEFIIIKKDFKLINEFNVIKRIKFIDNYFYYYLIPNDQNISQLNEPNLFLIKVEKNITFGETLLYLFNQNNLKKLFLFIVNSFKKIFQSVLLLNKSNICYFNISLDNVILICDNNLLLSNFQRSILTSKLNKQQNLQEMNYIKNIIFNITDYTYLPIEIHLLFYIFKNNLNKFTSSIIEVIVDKFTENLLIFNCDCLYFSQNNNIKIKFKNKCIEYLKEYLNQDDIFNIIYNIFERNKTWDIYGISLIYLETIFMVYDMFYNNSNCIHNNIIVNFFDKIIELLFVNIEPNSNNRYTLKYTMNQINYLIDNTFVDNTFDNV